MQHPPPRLSLSGLPLEIRSRIALLARDQDERFKERWGAGASPRRSGHRLASLVKNEMHGRSLVALSQTSKDFYEIAVKLMYHTLSERQAVSPHGRMRFIPRHASLVRTLDLGTFGSAAEEKARAFATLPLLPNVNELHLNGDAMATIFGGQAAFDAGATVDSERHALPRNPSAIEIEQEEYALAREIWRERAPHLRAVQMFALQVEDATRFLDTMTKLESVNLIILKDLEAYLDALAHRPHLLHLTIRSGRPGTWNWPTGPLEWTTSLKSLNLHNLDVTPGFYTFLDHFAPSLQTLNIVFSTKLSQNRVLPPSPVLPSPFPFLKELHLHIVDCTVASAILSSLAPTAGGRLPSPLQNVDVTFTSIGDLDETLETLLDAFKSTLKLRRVVYGVRENLGFVGPRPTGWTRDSRSDTFLLREIDGGDWGMTSAEVFARSEASLWSGLDDQVGAMLAYGRELLDSAVRNKDGGAIEVLLDAVGKLKGLHLLRDD